MSVGAKQIAKALLHRPIGQQPSEQSLRHECLIGGTLCSAGQRSVNECRPEGEKNKKEQNARPDKRPRCKRAHPHAPCEERPLAPPIPGTWRIVESARHGTT